MKLGLEKNLYLPPGFCHIKWTRSSSCKSSCDKTSGKVCPEDAGCTGLITHQSKNSSPDLHKAAGESVNELDLRAGARETRNRNGPIAMFERDDISPAQGLTSRWQRKEHHVQVVLQGQSTRYDSFALLKRECCLYF
jgi:hypothetical protein